MSRAAAQSLVYFVRIGKWIKIGFTTNLDQRLKTFRTSAFDVDLLFSMPGDRDLESRLHGLLDESRLERELFRPEWRVTGFIEVYNYAGLDRAMQYLEETSPSARARKREEDRLRRLADVRQSKAEKDAHFASLVAERKNRIGW